MILKIDLSSALAIVIFSGIFLISLAAYLRACHAALLDKRAVQKKAEDEPRSIVTQIDKSTGKVEQVHYIGKRVIAIVRRTDLFSGTSEPVDADAAEALRQITDSEARGEGVPLFGVQPELTEALRLQRRAEAQTRHEQTKEWYLNQFNRDEQTN